MSKVYVSSTFVDLLDFREKVKLVLRRMGHEDVAMEYYIAEDLRPVDRCLRDVAGCDLYIGIFAWRYGWIPGEANPEGYSITEMEYRQALRHGKPCLIFLLSDEAPWPPKFIDSDRARIERLRNELALKHATGTPFKSADDLGRLAAEAIHVWEKQRGGAPSGARIPELDLTAYFAALTKHYQRLDLDALTPPQKEEYLQLHLRSVFVEQNVRENPPPVELPKEVWEKLQRDKEIHPDDLPSGIMPDDVLRAHEAYYERPSRPVLDALADARHPYSVILGDPGSGKSTLARYVLLSLMADEGDEKLRHAFAGHLPFLIELRSYAGLCADRKCDTFLEFIEYLSKTEGWQLQREALDIYLKTVGRVVVIFDGLDEVFDPQKREQIERRIVGFATDYPKARIIVTSRIIGYRRKILTDADFVHFTLQDMDERQVADFVDHWYALALSDRPGEAAAMRERIMRSFSESASVRQLAGNPMLLTIMAIIGKHQELPRERWKLYDHAARVLIQHWDVSKHLKDLSVEAPFIGEEDKVELLRRLAYKMQGGAGGPAGNYIHREELQAEFEAYLKGRFGLSPDRATAVARSMISQFHERNFILSLYGAKLYGFVHRAFLEYFCATAFVRMFEKTRELTLEELKHGVFGAHWGDRSWHEVLRLICGMIDVKFAGEIINRLSDELTVAEVDQINKERIHKLAASRWAYGSNRPKRSVEIKVPMPWNIALAINCIGELRDAGAVWQVRGKVIDQVFELIILFIFNFAPLEEFIHEHITPAVVASKITFSDAGQLDRCVNMIPTVRSGYYHYRSPEDIGKILVNLGAGFDTLRASLRTLLKQRSTIARSVGLSAITQGWPDDTATFRLLSTYATRDPQSDVRATAVREIGKHFKDDGGTLPLLRDRALNDAHPDVRIRAILELVRHFSDDPQTFPLLRDRAVNDEREQVRRLAIKELGKQTVDDVESFLVLQDRAINEPTLFPTVSDYPYEVRTLAIETLATRWATHPDTLPLLRERAEKDPMPWIREKAKKLADEIESAKDA